jgi:hypothetical protein
MQTWQEWWANPHFLKTEKNGIKVKQVAHFHFA